MDDLTDEIPNKICIVNEEGMVCAIRTSLEGEGTQTITWEQVKLEASADKTCRWVVQAIRDGFPEQKSTVGDKFKRFYL